MPEIALIDGAATFVTEQTDTPLQVNPSPTTVSTGTVMGAIMDFANDQDVRDSHPSLAPSERGIETAQARATVDGSGLSSDRVFNWAGKLATAKPACPSVKNRFI
ncbi:MAG: hypothetical protein AB7G62_04080 [Magnetospirillum sp.]